MPSKEGESAGSSTMGTVRIASGFADFAETVKDISGADVNLCFQCAKCASGCPVSFAMDYTPTQLVHAIQLGLADLVLNSRTFWLCASCQTCSTRCPQDVDLAGVMDAVRITAQHQGTKAAVPGVAAFCANFLRSIYLFGRVYELGLIAALKLSTGSLTKDVGVGLRMLRHGKLRVLPSFGGAVAARRVISQAKAREKL